MEMPGWEWVCRMKNRETGKLINTVFLINSVNSKT